MSAGQTIRLTNEVNRARASRWCQTAPHGAIVNIKPPSRTNDQNALLWVLLSEVSRAKPEGRMHTPDVWKALFMSACGHAVQFETGLDGAPFPIGFRSSRMNKAEMTDLIEFIFAWCAEKGVKLSEAA